MPYYPYSRWGEVFRTPQKLFGDNIIVGSITADEIAAGTLTSDSGVFGDISADYIKAGTLDTTEIFVASALTLGTDGIIRTAGSGTRIEIANNPGDKILFHYVTNQEAPGELSIALEKVTLKGIQTSVVENPPYIELYQSKDTGSTSMRFFSSGTSTFDAALETPKVFLTTVGAPYAIRFDGEEALTGIGHDGTGLTFGAERLSPAATASWKMNEDGQFLTSDGDASLPSLSFLNDTDSGLFRVTTNVIGIATSSSERFRFTTTYFLHNTTGGPALKAGAGSAATPAYSFTNDDDNGWYRPVANQQSWSVGGVENLHLRSGQLRAPAGAVGSPGYGFLTASNYGMFFSTGYLNLVASGVTQISMSDTNDEINFDASKVYYPNMVTTLSSAERVVRRKDSDGQVGGTTSSKRAKKFIREDVKGLETITQLRPVTFAWKATAGVAEPRWTKGRELGLVAEEVVEVEPKLVPLTDDDEPDAVVYDMLVVPLIKAVQELHERIETLETFVQL